MKNQKLILVDLYNTLIRNEVKLLAYKNLYSDIKIENPNIDFSLRVFINESMKQNKSIEELISFFDVKINKESLSNFNRRITEEMNSIIYNEKLIEELNSYNVPISLVSNLSKEYSRPLVQLYKKIKFDKIYLSYELGVLKPNPGMFKIIKKDYGHIPVNNIIIIGDGLINEGQFAKDNNINFRHIKEWY